MRSRKEKKRNRIRSEKRERERENSCPATKKEYNCMTKDVFVFEAHKRKEECSCREEEESKNGLIGDQKQTG
jgi:hypothetical protein